MNIKRAKQEIKDTVQAYLMKNQFGEYEIPSVGQRPILLMGPPGIGKTQIVEQAARECGINLVAYTITHHTRQSAMGLPFIQERTYDGQRRSVTEYTMSEIIASVYEKIEETGISEGILFIDEINCVSETLAPAMLQFLQCKTFGNQAVPEGWIIVSAGNPPQYNKSVREFDVVTLDRMKRIEVEESFEVWKEYAYQEGIHPAVISYLDIRREHFYKMETSVEGRSFATARGWEDLSRLLKVYEKMGKVLDRDVVYQYIQHWKIAKDFANYLELFEKYKTDYQIDQVLEGHLEDFPVHKLSMASFDEKFSVVGLFMGKLGDRFRQCHETDMEVSMVFEILKEWKASLLGERPAWVSLEDFRDMENRRLEEQQKAKQLTRQEEHIRMQVLELLKKLCGLARETEEKGVGKETVFQTIKQCFGKEVETRSRLLASTGQAMQNAFDFMERAFGEGQELVVFVTELNTNPYSLEFISENGCDSYYKYNKKLLFDQENREILGELEAIEEDL